MLWRRQRSSLTATAAQLLYPQYCLLCGEMGAQLVCPRCADALERVSHPICPRCGKPLKTDVPRATCLHCEGRKWYVDRSRSLFRYEGQARELLHRFKYGRVRGLARFFGDEIGRAYPGRTGLAAHFGWELGDEPQVALPLPLHFLRRAVRGFNQSELVLKFCCEGLELPVDTALLRRRRNTPAQARLTMQQRFDNVRNAFAVPQRVARRVEGRRVLLFDDIITTGATANAAARALKQAGAEKVYALSLSAAMLK
jgi:ComF family protein